MSSDTDSTVESIRTGCASVVNNDCHSVTIEGACESETNVDEVFEDRHQNKHRWEDVRSFVSGWHSPHP